MQAVAHRATDILEVLSPDEVCKILWAFGELCIYEPKFLEAVSDRCVLVLLPKLVFEHVIAGGM